MTKVLKVDPARIAFDGSGVRIAPSSTLDHLQEAVKVLRSNQPVAFPTETVYGLGANCQNTNAVQSIYTAKNRPADNPLIIHVSSRKQLESKLLPQGVPAIYEPLLAAFWPGPLTILVPLPSNTQISTLCTKGQSTFGVRMPRHPVARALIELSDLPLAAPSANASTKPSCTLAQHVLADMNGKIPLILDGGSSDVGVESTVVDGLVNPPQILRPGGVSLEQIKDVGGEAWKDVVVANPTAGLNEKVRTPGMKYRHYSPRATVILASPQVKIESVKKALSTRPARKIAVLRTKTWPSDISFGDYESVDLPLGLSGGEISHNLFAAFREADEANVDAIVVEAVPLDDEGLAIMNRMKKAADEYVQ